MRGCSFAATGNVVLTLITHRHHDATVVFSSSATVYGENPNPPFDEDQPTSATNPYGWTKVMWP